MTFGTFCDISPIFSCRSDTKRPAVSGSDSVVGIQWQWWQCWNSGLALPRGSAPESGLYPCQVEGVPAVRRSPQCFYNVSSHRVSLALYRNHLSKTERECTRWAWEMRSGAVSCRLPLTAVRYCSGGRRVSARACVCVIHPPGLGVSRVTDRTVVQLFGRRSLLCAGMVFSCGLPRTDSRCALVPFLSCHCPWFPIRVYIVL